MEESGGRKALLRSVIVNGRKRREELGGSLCKKLVEVVLVMAGPQQRWEGSRAFWETGKRHILTQAHAGSTLASRVAVSERLVVAAV